MNAIYQKAIAVLVKQLTEAELIELWEAIEGEARDEFFWELNAAVADKRSDLFTDDDGDTTYPQCRERSK